MAVGANIVLGNIYVAGDIKLEMRFGYNMPKGFVLAPDDIGRTMHYEATLAPAKPKSYSLPGSLAFDSSVTAYSIFQDSDKTNIERKPYVQEVILGLHYMYQVLATDLTLVLQAV